MTVSTPSDVRIDRRLAVLVFLVATAIATVFVQFRMQTDHLGEEPLVGIHLAQGHGFRTPLDPSPTAEVTAWVPPAYPLITAAAFRLFGIATPAAFRVLVEINAICYGLVVSGVFVIGRLLVNRPVGLLAAALVVLDPLFLLMAHRVWHTYLAQASLAWLIVAALCIQRSGATRWRLAGIGAGMGLLVQINGSFLLVAPVLVWVAVRDAPVRRWAMLSAVAAGAFAVVLVPWTARNYVVFHKLMYVRRGAELELWLGNRPGSSGWQDLREHPSVYLPEREVMLQLGEERYFALCKERFQHDYDADPAAYWWRTGRRIEQLVIGEPMVGQVDLGTRGAWIETARWLDDALVFSLGMAGFAVAWWRGYRTAWLIVLSIASTVPYIISHMNYRFTLHLKLYLLLMVATLAWTVWQRLRTGAWPRQELGAVGAIAAPLSVA